jgi:ArsR family transcriptional regulator
MNNCSYEKKNKKGGWLMSDKDIKCGCSVIHEDKVNAVKDKIFDDSEIFELGDFFKVLGDSTRMKIINALFYEELCVCDIASVLNMTQSATSHQLRVLKQAKLVKNRRDGKVMYYSLDDDHVKGIFDMGISHIRHT